MKGQLSCTPNAHRREVSTMEQPMPPTTMLSLLHLQPEPCLRALCGAWTPAMWPRCCRTTPHWCMRWRMHTCRRGCAAVQGCCAFSLTVEHLLWAGAVLFRVSLPGVLTACPQAASQHTVPGRPGPAQGHPPGAACRRTARYKLHTGRPGVCQALGQPAASAAGSAVAWRRPCCHGGHAPCSSWPT